MSKLKPSAWRTFDAARSITARELNNVPSENGRRDRCASLYPVPLYGADALAEARRQAFIEASEIVATASLPEPTNFVEKLVVEGARKFSENVSATLRARAEETKP